MSKRSSLKTKIGWTCTLIVVFFLVWLSIPQGYKADDEQALQEIDSCILKKTRGKLIDGYQKRPLEYKPSIPSMTPSDDGITQIMGNDSVELYTDIPAGKKYLIVIETGRRIPLWALFDENGDSIEWDCSTQILRPNDSIYVAKLLKYSSKSDSLLEIPFWVEEYSDSLRKSDICSIEFLETSRESLDKTGNLIKIDSIRSGIMQFPAFASGTTLVQQAGDHAERIYVKVMQPGIVSLTVSSAEDACGFALLEWPQCNFIKKIPSCNSRRGFYFSINSLLQSHNQSFSSHFFAFSIVSSKFSNIEITQLKYSALVICSATMLVCSVLYLP